MTMKSPTWAQYYTPHAIAVYAYRNGVWLSAETAKAISVICLQVGGAER